MVLATEIRRDEKEESHHRTAPQKQPIEILPGLEGDDIYPGLSEKINGWFEDREGVSEREEFSEREEAVGTGKDSPIQIREPIEILPGLEGDDIMPGCTQKVDQLYLPGGLCHGKYERVFDHEMGQNSLLDDDADSVKEEAKEEDADEDIAPFDVPIPQEKKLKKRPSGSGGFGTNSTSSRYFPVRSKGNKKKPGLLRMFRMFRKNAAA